VLVVIEKLTGGNLGPGSLYGALSRLEARKLIRPAEPEH
jgi:DNA-binding PadR family transcriptional regulator